MASQNIRSMTREKERMACTINVGCMHGAGGLCLTTFPVRTADSGVVAEVHCQHAQN
jgi:hypothetical protein